MPKVSQYHKTHGLEVVLRSPRTGQTMHFNLPKTATRELVHATFAGKSFEGYLELLPRPGAPAGDDVDMVLMMVIPATVVPKARSAKATSMEDMFKGHPAFEADLSKIRPREEEVVDQPPSRVFSVFDEKAPEPAVTPPRFDRVETLAEIAQSSATKVNPLNPPRRDARDLRVTASPNDEREPVNPDPGERKTAQQRSQDAMPPASSEGSVERVEGDLGDLGGSTADEIDADEKPSVEPGKGSGGGRKGQGQNRRRG